MDMMPMRQNETSQSDIYSFKMHFSLRADVDGFDSLCQAFAFFFPQYVNFVVYECNN